MKTLLIACLSLISSVLAAQTPPPQPPPPAPPAAPVAAASAAATMSPAASPASSLEQSIRQKHKEHFRFTIGDDDSDTEGSTSTKHHGDKDDIPAAVVPLVGMIVLTVFGTPVLIVAVIMYFGFSKSRMQHRTVKMLLEKGQPVPPELLAQPAPAVRQRNDMRRGVVWLMVGLGMIIFLGAVNDWEGGAWALGIIPFLIGAGYLLVWKFEGGKTRADNPPPVA